MSRLAAQYFLYFSVMAIFLPYFTLYCHALNFDGFQIGMLTALRSMVMVFFSMVWSLLADHFQIRRSIFITCSFLSALIWGLLLYTTQFTTIVVIMLSYTIFYAPIIAFLEAMTMDILADAKNNYGKIRVWGSLAFIIVVIVLGRLIDLYSVKIIIILILILSLIQAFFAFKIPHIKPSPLKISALDQKSLYQPRMIIFLIVAFLMLVSHGAYYNFFSIHLAELGCSGVWIGFNWALATTVEIMVMLFSGKLFQRLAVQKILLFSFVVAGLRWLVLSKTQSPLLILFSQIMHAGSYASFHIASILYIDQLTPAGVKTTGQTLNNAVTYGLGLMTGFFLSGILYTRLGVSALFSLSSMTALLGGLLFGLQVFLIKK